MQGFSGRDSIKIFNEFYSAYAKEDTLINMSFLNNFFTRVRKDLSEHIPYTQQGATEVCIYVIDNDLAKTFERSAGQ